MIGAVTGAVNVLTPCLGICRINQRSQLCEGCRRSAAEVAEWLFYSNEKKRAIMKQLVDRDPFDRLRQPLNESGKK